MSGKLVTVPIGFGKIDPSKLGRRRRSIDLLLHQLVSDLSAKDKLSNEIGQSEVKEREDGEHENNTDVQKPARNILVNYELLSHPHLPVKLLAK
ncbi:hypothetical protein RUM44_004258 [Polyplax serrata]|uniref:Uncharacterized protein n=1 Tax=Polyplax serrata TaxID=468196 RepID=A0ABR1B2A9_POLSC